MDRRRSDSRFTLPGLDGIRMVRYGDAGSKVDRFIQRSIRITDAPKTSTGPRHRRRTRDVEIECSIVRQKNAASRCRGAVQAHKQEKERGADFLNVFQLAVTPGGS